MSDRSSAPQGAPDLGFCRGCARTVHGASFSDGAAYHVYTRCGLCQACQDVLPRSEGAGECDAFAPVLHGVVLGAAVEGTRVREVALVPFQYDAAFGRFECEPADIVRAGDAPEPLDAFVELAAARPVWDHRRERVLTVGALCDPLLGARILRNHLVLVLDGVSAGVAERLCPTLRRPPLVDLSAAVPWAGAFGAPLQALLCANAPGAVVRFTSALHQCACVLRLLDVPALGGAHRGSTVFDHVLFGLVTSESVPAEALCGAPH